MRTAVAVADAHEEGARRALLERLATDMAVIADPWTRWTCCWLSYTGPHGLGWAWRFCNGNPPGTLQEPPCGHWHHQWEIFMASGEG